MSGIREVSKQVKLYAFVNGASDSVFVLRVAVTEENGIPLFVDLDHLKQDILTRLPPGKAYDVQSLTVFAGNDLSGSVIQTPSDLISALKKDLSRIKLAANVQLMPSYMLDDAKQISPPPLRPEDVEPGQPPAPEDVAVVVESPHVAPVELPRKEVPAEVVSTVVLPEPQPVVRSDSSAVGKLEQSVVIEQKHDDSAVKIAMLSAKLQEIAKERDECLLYAQLLQSENQKIRAEAEEKNNTTVSPPVMTFSTGAEESQAASKNAEALSRIEAVLPSLSVKAEMTGVNESMRSLDSRLSSLESKVVGQASTVDSLNAGVARVNEVVASYRKDMSELVTLVGESVEVSASSSVKVMKGLKDCFDALARTSQQVMELNQSLVEIKEAISSSNRDLEQRMSTLLEEKLSQAIAKYALTLQVQSMPSAAFSSAAAPVPFPNTTALSRQSSLEPDSPAPPIQSKLNKAESTIPVETSANPRARVEMFESKNDLKLTQAQPHVEAEADADVVPEDDEEPTDSGFRIVSLPKPVVADNSASELAKSLTASQIRYAPQLAELESMGFKVRSLNSLLLNMHNGDMSKVVAELQKLQKQHVAQ